ncbi:uncharacterized protein LOC133900492 [Phragmites australis]|uniref:uncharacterized protein LOC133900492 n=1 Tax=Phragmites australis TaxID=29695 RepID=UPI002D79C5B6|nr:uncharacterized protein LOC133900492 [Phragmites australis]
MGNCLVIQDRKEIKQLQGALAEPPPGHGISGVLPAAMAPTAVDDPGAVRVKLVVSKQELKKMLDKEGMSLDDVVTLMRKEANARDSDQGCCGGWRPALESIPEGSSFSS